MNDTAIVLNAVQGCAISFAIVARNQDRTPISLVGYTTPTLVLKPLHKIDSDDPATLILTEGDGITLTAASGRLDYVITATKAAGLIGEYAFMGYIVDPVVGRVNLGIVGYINYSRAL